MISSDIMDHVVSKHTLNYKGVPVAFVVQTIFVCDEMRRHDMFLSGLNTF